MTQSWLYGKLLGGLREVTNSSREWSPSLFQLVSVMLLPHKCLPTPRSPSLCLWDGSWQVGVSLGGHILEDISHKAGWRGWTEHAQTRQSLYRVTFLWEELSGHRETRSGGLEGRSSALWETSGKRNEGFHFEPANTTSYEQQALC